MKKNKLFTLSLLLSLPALLGSKTDYRYFEFLPLTFGPVEKGEDFPVSSGVYTYIGGVKFTYSVSLYDRYPSRSDKVLLWQFKEKRTTEYDDQELYFDYVIPKEFTLSTIYIAFTYSYYYYPVGTNRAGHSTSNAYAELEPYTKVGDEVFSFNDGEEIEGSSYFTMRYKRTTRYMKPYLKMYSRYEEVGEEIGCVPFSAYWRLYLYNKKYNESLPNLALPELDARLEIYGPEASYFADIADYYYKSNAYGGTAGFKMKINKLYSIYHRFALPADTFLVDKYSGKMRRGSEPKENETKTVELYLPRRKEHTSYKMKVFTTKSSTSFNFPRFSMSFTLLSDGNRFGNCLDSDYCVGASYE